MTNEVDVFVQNLAGSYVKNRHNETTLVHLGSSQLNEPYPYAYGFIPKTIAADGDCLDCYILSSSVLEINSLNCCTPVGVLEQFENNEPDHKVLAVGKGESESVDDVAISRLRHFVNRASQQFTDTVFTTGAVLSQSAAIEFISKSKHNVHST